MASPKAPKEGRYVSIGLKIFTVALILLALMGAVTALTVHMAAEVNRELKALGHGYVAAYGALARANIRSVQRAVLIRRVYINATDGEERTATRELLRRSEELAKEMSGEIAAARGFVQAEIAAGSGLHDLVALSRLDTLIEVLTEQRHDLSERQAALLQALAEGAAPAGLRRLMGELDQEREKFDEQLEETRAQLFKIVTAAADTAQARQANVVRAVVVITALAATLGLMVAGGFSRGLSRPVRRLLAGTRAVQGGKLDTVIPVTSRDEIGLLTSAFNDMVAELKVKSQIKETFGKYVDPRIVEGLIDRPELVSGKGERRTMTILFCDMKGSTALGDLTTASGLVSVLNRYLTVMSIPVREHGGIIDKYIGDGVMAFWGPPFVAADAQASLACAAALDQIAALPGLAAELPDLIGVRRGLPPLGIRIGIATGEVLVGSIGSELTKSYTVMGATVNLASRLEAANKRFGTTMLVSAATALQAQGAIELREIDQIEIAGFGEPERVFEILGRRGEVDAALLEMRERYAEGLAAYRDGEWTAAREAFATCLAIRPGDGPAGYFLARLETLA
jgi:adenylate cyclase